MAGFPYGAVRGLGGMQIFLGIAAMGLGGGDLAMSLSFPGPRYVGYNGRFFLGVLGTGIWTGLFIGAAQTMSLLNAVVFAPGLASVSGFSVAMNHWEWLYGVPDHNPPYGTYYYPELGVMTYLESTLAVVGCLEFIFSIATASVCCCGGSYDQPAANQVVPMPMVAFQTASQQPATRPNWNMARGPPGVATGGDGQMVTITAAELGMLYAKANNITLEE
ncbi:PREDICTED: uncharacterized protein LOC109484323 [Branchiostoma belcheri]|uniref:Uncharacterized protein LOC109484323 n=1 Tax=Branchiostoma belcheri TaxID=7741 RepID=A0A6P5AJ08_BRABE|nr:PREDICTED: uncharacterized protein LOC109484323 [Branchiostoma belcheri]